MAAKGETDPGLIAEVFLQASGEAKDSPPRAPICGRSALRSTFIPRRGRRGRTTSCCRARTGFWCELRRSGPADRAILPTVNTGGMFSGLGRDPKVREVSEQLFGGMRHGEPFAGRDVTGMGRVPKVLAVACRAAWPGRRKTIKWTDRSRPRDGSVYGQSRNEPHQAGLRPLELNLDHSVQADRAPYAIVDIGSNSVRIVVYDQLGRAPLPRFNEKSLCRLGEGLAQTGADRGARISGAPLRRSAASAPLPTRWA